MLLLLLKQLLSFVESEKTWKHFTGHDSNVQFIDQDDIVDKNLTMNVSQPFSQGRAFGVSLLDALVGTVCELANQLKVTVLLACPDQAKSPNTVNIWSLMNKLLCKR